mmetsp:Transcript_8295/g.17845  ORF Transcript_8295/g.17845 Transcript_8295/m.17845 type:complete len:286 (+) Transcript_8295:1139-1996(+)
MILTATSSPLSPSWDCSDICPALGFGCESPVPSDVVRDFAFNVDSVPSAVLRHASRTVLNAPVPSIADGGKLACRLLPSLDTESPDGFSSRPYMIFAISASVANTRFPTSNFLSPFTKLLMLAKLDAAPNDPARDSQVPPLVSDASAVEPTVFRLSDRPPPDVRCLILRPIEPRRRLSPPTKFGRFDTDGGEADDDGRSLSLDSDWSVVVDRRCLLVGASSADSPLDSTELRLRLRLLEVFVEPELLSLQGFRPTLCALSPATSSSAIPSLITDTSKSSARSSDA